MPDRISVIATAIATILGPLLNRFSRWCFLLLLCALTSVFRNAEAQPSRWTSDETIPGTQWVYNEERVNGVLNQCQIELKTKAVNKSASTLTIAVLSKGSLVLDIRDSDWTRRIEMDFGWKEGKEFQNVLLHLNTGRIAAVGRIASDEDFIIPLPKTQEILLNTFFQSGERFAVTVGGLTFKAWTAPGLARAWETLRKCALL